MGYHLIDPTDLDQWDDRPTDVRSLRVAAGHDYQNSKLGLRVYELAPGEQSGLSYHILGHPKHLISLDELEYMLPKSKASIKAQLDNLIDADIIALYTYEPSKGTHDLPSQFYGFMERGVQILYDYKYLRGLPVARALYDNTRKSRKIERHETAPRPNLPETVASALEFDESDLGDVDTDVNVQTTDLDER